jgi:hypothetical protein
MKILVLGLDHRIQETCDYFPNPRKDKYEALLRHLVEDHAVEFIGVETFADKETIAQKAANSLTGVHCEPAEMSLEQRAALGIAEEQKCRPSENVRVLSDTIREAYMVWRTITKAGAAQSSLILCGRLRTEALVELFQNAGHEAEADDLRNYDWYREAS